MKPRVLVVDDELNMRRILAAMLRREGYETLTAEDGVQALKLLREEEIAAVVTDMRMPLMDGLKLLEHVRREYPAVPVILVTAHGSVSTAVQAMKRGAFDFVTKPFETDELKLVVSKAVAAYAAAQRDLVPENDDDFGDLGMIGQSRAMQELRRLVRKVASSPTTVLITGESGTGKELVATAIHKLSDRADQPLIKINCTTIPEPLIESELFGYERGAFTGAVTAKPGRFELADGGTLFLDEIGELPREMQAKLLRAIQESEFERVGGIKTIHVDVRLIAATNRVLEEMVRKGEFRQDLYYRLNIVPIQLPPLRERRDDIPLLINHFIKKFNRRLGRNVTGFTPAAIQALMDYHWPGNIRELENIMQRVILLSDNDLIDVTDLPPALEETETPSELTAWREPNLSLKEIVRQRTEVLEKSLIRAVLKETNGNVTQAAKRLQISRKSLQLKMKEYGLRE
jgi:DNA-binding NtrC family response regulator